MSELDAFGELTRGHPSERHSRIDRAALDELQRRFLDVCPDFQSFANPGTGPIREERDYKVAAMGRVQSALTEYAKYTAAEDLGKAVFKILKTAAKDGPLVRWKTEHEIIKNTPELLGEFHRVIGRLIRSRKPEEICLSKAFDAFRELRSRGARILTYGEHINILFSSLSMVRPRTVAPLKITRINEAWDFLTGEKLFVEAKADMASDYRHFSEVFTEIFDIMWNKWRWEPQDWLDIQSFLWIAFDTTTVQPKLGISPDVVENRESIMPKHPVNRILYGPPGTGKTFATATEAVELCGERAPEDRSELMASYQRLMTAGRIEFVTFHQSMSYEEFVEGRQPVTGSDEDQETASAGFRLKTVSGIFRRIAKRAEINAKKTEIGRELSSRSGRSKSPAEKSFVLIIDEINRANISKVFGELITLFEPDKRLNQTNALKVRLPYSGDEFGVPSNLHILGTMNTADRSIALLDTALRRRFTFHEMMPDPSVLAGVVEKCGIDLPHLLTTINERIEYLYDREHQIGHAYFTECASRTDVDEVMRHKVIPLLAEYFFEDWAKIAAVLGDLESHDGPISGSFLKRMVLKAPPGLEDGDASLRFRWQVRSETEGFDYENLAGA